MPRRTTIARRLTALFISALLMSATASPAHAYGVLSHEELIDISWNSDIRPTLLRQFPSTTPEQLEDAHAFAYGGSVIQDLGYYPFGNHEFTDLLHYVRTGKFIMWMLRDAQNVNEYAFALGAVSHYAADAWGHPAVNIGVAIEYPKLKAKYGPLVTYEDNPEAHLKTEFSFDVLQVAKRRYIAKQYHDFIGFRVSEELLERAFRDTYGVDMDDLLHFDDLTIGTYRFSVSRVVPEMTQVAIASRKPADVSEKKDKARSEFLYHLSRADYEKEFGTNYRGPGFFAKFLAFLLKLIPKFGPFKALQYRDPTPVTEDHYFRSMNNVVNEYHHFLEQINASQDPSFLDRNLDTGDLTKAGDYKLADRTYCRLVRRLAHDDFSHLTRAIKTDLLAFFASGHAETSVSKHEWKETQKALALLKAQAPTAH
jgi:hypothetical protein